jgi:hypothetical protein
MHLHLARKLNKIIAANSFFHVRVQRELVCEE